jgi:hypothetical protein
MTEPFLQIIDRFPRAKPFDRVKVTQVMEPEAAKVGILGGKFGRQLAEPSVNSPIALVIAVPE